MRWSGWENEGCVEEPGKRGRKKNAVSSKTTKYNYVEIMLRWREKIVKRPKILS